MRQAFENLHRKENEGVQADVSRVNDIVNQMRGLGDTMPESLAVGKIFRSLGARYNFLVATISEVKDLTKLTIDKLSKSLQAYEFLMFNQDANSEAPAYTVRLEASGLKQEGKTPVKEDASPFKGKR